MILRFLHHHDMEGFGCQGDVRFPSSVGLNKCDFTPYEMLAFLGLPVFGVFTPYDMLPCFGLL